MSNRILMGLDGGTYVLKISKPGVNVLTANKGDLLFDSTNSQFGQIVKAGSVEVDAGTSQDVSLTLPSGMSPVVVIDAGSRTSILGDPQAVNSVDNFLLDYQVSMWYEVISSSTLRIHNNSSQYDLTAFYVVYTIDSGAL